MELDTKSLKNQLYQLASITSGKQKEYYNFLYQNAKEIKCVSVSTVFSPAEIRIIKQVIKPSKKECYKNATQLTMLFPDKVLYCEGLLNIYGLGIEHAFNKVGDYYVDITAEFALKNDVNETQYLSYAEFNAEKLDEILTHNNYYGDITKTYFIKMK